MKKISKCELDLKNRNLIQIKKVGLFSYAAFQGNKMIAKSKKFKKYINEIIRLMYTGVEYGTGDYILEADTVDGIKEICRWS